GTDATLCTGGGRIAAWWVVSPQPATSAAGAAASRIAIGKRRRATRSRYRLTRSSALLNELHVKGLVLPGRRLPRQRLTGTSGASNRLLTPPVVTEQPDAR